MDKIDKNVEAFNRSGELSSDDLIGLIDKRIVDVEVDISVASDIDKELMFLELRELDNLRKSLAEMGKLDIEELSVSERKKYDLAIQAVASKLEIELDSIFSLADFREEVESKEDLIDFCRENMKFLPLDKHVGDVNALSIAKLRSLKKNIGKYQEHFDRFMEVFNYFPTSVSEKISLKYFYKLVESSPKSISASIKGLSKVLKNIKSKLKEQKTLRIKIKAKMQEVQAQTEINNQLKGLKAIKEEEEDNLVVRLFKLASKSTAKSQVVSDDLFVVIGALLNGSDAQKLTKKVGKAIDDETEMYSFHDDHLSRVLISTKSETVVLEKAKALVDPMAALDDLNATYKGFVTMITRDPSLGGGGTPGQMQELVDQMQVLQEKILPKRTELLMVQVDHLKGLKKLLRGDFALGKKIFAKLQGEVSMEERALFEASFRL